MSRSRKRFPAMQAYGPRFQNWWKAQQQQRTRCEVRAAINKYLNEGTPLDEWILPDRTLGDIWCSPGDGGTAWWFVASWHPVDERAEWEALRLKAYRK